MIDFFFRYGREMGSATENALSTVGNSYLTAYNAAALGPKSLAKRAAKTTGLYILMFTAFWFHSP